MAEENQVLRRVLDDMLKKLERDRRFRCQDSPLDELVEALADATQLEIEVGGRSVRPWTDGGMFEWLGRALSIRKYPNLHKCSVRQVRESHRMDHQLDIGEGFLFVLQSIASGHSPNLEDLDLISNVSVGVKGVGLIVRAAEAGHLSKLETLSIMGLDDGCCEALGNAALRGHFRPLQSLRLVGGKVRLLSDGGVQYLARAMEAGCLQKLRTLEITHSGMGDQGAEWLAGALKSGHVQALECLDLASHHIQAKGFRALASALEEGFVPSLKCLHLGVRETCVEKGGEAIARALASQHLSHLEKLDLSHVGGGAAVASALASSAFPDLKVLILSTTELEEEGAVALAKAWESHRFPRLEQLSLLRNVLGNELGEEAWKALTAALASQSNSNLRRFSWGSPPSDDAIVGLATALEKSQSHLRKLERVALGGGKAPIGEVGAAALVNAYRNNPYLTAYLGVIWPEGKPWHHNWSGFRDRNERRAADLEALRAERQVDATHGRVFLCGAPKVGKTTLRKSLSRASSPFPAYCWAPPSVQERTRGIEVVQIGNGELSLALWDLAGQPEYHLLHGALFPDLAYTDVHATLFVVVCRANAETTDNGADHDDLRYWLRFIASSSLKGVEGFKRKVLVVLNRFQGDTCSRIDSWNLWLDQFKRDFHESLDIEMLPATSIFDVRSPQSAKRFKKLLFSKTRELLRDKKIPQMCLHLAHELRQCGKNQRAYPVLSWTDVQKRVSDSVTPDEELVAALQYLSQVGIVINFPKGALRDGGLPDLSLTVVSPEWFCREIVGHLLLPEAMWNPANESLLRKKLDQANCMTLAVLKSSYKELNELQVNQTVAMLLRLGLCFKVGTDKVFIPALVPKESPLPSWWTDCEPMPGQWVMGFTLVPQDADRTLLPASLFARLQVELAQLLQIQTTLGNDFCAGSSFVAFKANGVKVLVEYRAQEVNSVTDRIDVMAKPLLEEQFDCSNEERRKRRTEQVNFADFIVDKLDGIRRSSCPGVQFEKRIIRPWSTADGYLGMVARDIGPTVEDIKKDVKSLKPGDESTHWVVAGQRVCKMDLLSTEDLALVSEQLLKTTETTHRECDSMQEIGVALGILPQVLPGTIPKVRQTRSMPRMARAVSRDSGHRGGWMELRPALDDRVEVLEEEIHRVKGVLEDLRSDVEDLKSEVEKLKTENRKSLVRRSELIYKITGVEKFLREEMENTAPRYAYVTDNGDSGKWITLMDAMKKSCRLRLLCEARYKDQLLHEVRGQKGHLVSELRGWVKTCVPWLKISITLLTALSTVGAAAIPGLGALAPAIAQAALQVVDKAVQEVKEASRIITAIEDSSVSGSSATAMSPGTSGPLVEREPLKGLAKRALEDLLGSLTSPQFREDFKLRRVRFQAPMGKGADGRQCVVWICDECYAEYARENKVKEF